MSYSKIQRAYAYNPGHPSYDPAENAAIEAHEKAYGKYNDAPPGWREISEEEFLHGKFFAYPAEKQEFRQIRSETGGSLNDAELYFFHDGTGVAMMPDRRASKIRFFAFGCNHEYREIYGDEAAKLGVPLMGRCMHAYLCERCKHTESVDSSG